MYELIYKEHGNKRKSYPQTEEHARRLIQAIIQNAPAYVLISCENCNNYEAYKRGSDLYPDFLLAECEQVCLSDVTEEMEEDAVDSVIYAPFEYDKDLSYFILCEFDSFKHANEFYREATA